MKCNAYSKERSERWKAFFLWSSTLVLIRGWTLTSDREEKKEKKLCGRRNTTWERLTSHRPTKQLQRSLLETFQGFIFLQTHHTFKGSADFRITRVSCTDASKLNVSKTWTIHYIWIIFTKHLKLSLQLFSTVHSNVAFEWVKPIKTAFL